MRKLVLMALAGAAIVLAAPQVSQATPLVPASGVSAAADSVSPTVDVRHRRWHRRCVHRRHWSGRRCW
jgi:hypothetical protein